MDKPQAPWREKIEHLAPNSANPFGMLYMTRFGDNFHVYVKLDELRSIERLPAVKETLEGKTISERTKLRLAPSIQGASYAYDVILVNETPEEIFEQQAWLARPQSG